jgi:hypothetical protein
MHSLLLVEDNANNASLLEFAKPLSMRMMAARLRDFLQELEKTGGREYVSAQNTDR